MSKSKNNSYRKVEKIINGKKYCSYEARATVGKDPLTGKQKQISANGKTLKEANEKLNKKIEDYNSGCVVSCKYTVSDWIDIWLENYKADKKHSTLKSYTSICENHIKPIIGKVKLTELDSIKVQRFYNTLSEKKVTIGGCVESTTDTLAPKTIKNIHVTLSKCLSTAVDAGLIRSNPTEKAVLPKAISPEIEPLTNEQVSQFLGAAKGDEYYDVFALLLVSGFRKAEALAITWDCVDFKNNSIHICKQIEQRTSDEGGYVFSTLKNNKPRTVYIPQSVMNILKERKKNMLICKSNNSDDGMIHDKGMDNLVFTTATGKPVPQNTLYKHCIKIGKMIGRDNLRVHDLRHTYAVLSLQNGDDPKTLQNNLGHATAAFTLDRYGHATNDMKIASSKRMEEYISSAV